MPYNDYAYDDPVLDYINRHWRDHEGWDALNIMLDNGYDLLAADYIVSTGAINSATCYRDARKVERLIEQNASQYRRLSKKLQDTMHRECFKNVHTYTCQVCNHVSFVGDGNEELYATELKTCWACPSTNVVHDVMYPTKAPKV